MVGRHGAVSEAADRALTVHRAGARICVSANEGLSEAQARQACARVLADGERLLDCILREKQGLRTVRYAFVVWPRPVSHAARLLQRRPAA